MTQVGVAYVDVKPDLSGFSREVKGQLAGAQSGIKSQMSGFAKSAAAGLAAGAAVGLGVLAKNAISAASDINESLSKNDKLFGKYSKSVEKFADTSARSYGISKKAALEYTGVFGNLFRALGQSEKAASGNSVQLTKLAADMASFNNTSVEDALEAIRSGLVGETEPLRKFGVNMNDTTLKTEALALAKKGLISQAEATAKTLSPETKAMAAQSLIMKQTSQAHGDFKDTSKSLANQQKILKARLDDASAAIGARLLPFAVKGANALNDLLTSAQNGTGVFGAVKGAWDAVAGAFRGGSESGGQLRTIVQSLVDVSKGLVTIATAAWERFGGVITDQALSALKAFGGVLEGITTALKGLVDLVAGVFTGDWQRAWDGVQAIFEGVWKAITSGLQYQWETIKNVVRLGVAAIGTTIKAAAGALVDLGKWIVNRIVDGLKAYVQLWAGVAGWLKNRIVEAVKALASPFVDAGKWIVNRIAEGAKTVTSALSDVGGWLKNRIVEIVQREATGLVNIGTWIVNRVAEGAKTLTDGLASVGGWIKNRVVDGLDAVKDGFTSIGGSMIGWIVSGLKGGANKLVGFLNTIIGVINKLPGVDIGKIAGLAKGGAFSAAGIEAFATGGQVRRGTKLTAPMIMMGEEAPRHPEFVIPTNPAYRKRALGLYAQLGQEIGVGYADGGIIGRASGVLSDIGGAVGNAAKGVLDLPLKLLEKGASFILDQLPNPVDMLPQWMVGLGKHVIGKVGDWVKDKVTGLLGSAGGVQGAGGGVGQFDGKPVASWIIPILRAARASGVAFNVSSGFRSFAEQTVLWNKLGRDPAIVARPGTSNHEGAAYPRGAVDISPGWQALSAWLSRRNLPLHHYGNPRDPYHFSATGHAKGGIIQGPFVGSYRDGGIVPRDGLAYVHQGETITPGAGPTIEVNFRDDRLKDLIEIVVVEEGRRKGAMMRAGVLA